MQSSSDGPNLDMLRLLGRLTAARVAASRHHLLVPLAARDGVDPEQIHSVDLLQAPVLALNQEEEHHHHERRTAARKDQSVEIVDGVRDEAREEAHQEVPEPVARSRDRHGWGAVLGRVELGHHRPDEGAPGRSKRRDEQAREDDQDVARLRRVLGVFVVEAEVADKRIHQEAYHHPGGTRHQRVPPAALAHHVQAAESAGDIDGSQDYLGHVAVAKARGPEDGGSVVEEEVRTRELLPGLPNSE